MTSSIEVHNRQRAIKADVARLQSFAERALVLSRKTRASKKFLTTELPDIHVILISDRRMSELHHRFLKIEGPTDVITFQHGEIFISVETARRQARAFGTSLRQEIERYVVHGLLHLRGFDDKTTSASRMMKTQEERIARTASK